MWLYGVKNGIYFDVWLFDKELTGWGFRVWKYTFVIESSFPLFLSKTTKSQEATIVMCICIKVTNIQNLWAKHSLEITLTAQTTWVVLYFRLIYVMFGARVLFLRFNWIPFCLFALSVHFTYFKESSQNQQPKWRWI